MKNNTVIVYAKRTPIGKFLGALSTVQAPLFGAHLVKDALKNLKGLSGQDVSEIIMGQVLTAGCGQAPARQAAILGGLPSSVCATTINRVCGSGLKSVMLADLSLRLGEADVVFAGGQESMSLAPHLMMKSRTGYRFGAIEAKDHMQFDGLWDPYNNVSMGTCAEECADEFKFSRESQDAFAQESYKRAQKTLDSGLFAQEIVPFEIKQKTATTVEHDEQPHSVDLAKLSKLTPAFRDSGTITAGNASSISDGGALLVLMTEERAKNLGFKPLARVVAQASFAHEPKAFTTAPVFGIQKVLNKASLKAQDIDHFEINEAFAVVTMAAMQSLDLNPEKVNARGGAIALGHPIGASGARILVTLIHTLKHQKKRLGLASLCIGGGESSNLVIENMD